MADELAELWEKHKRGEIKSKEVVASPLNPNIIVPLEVAKRQNEVLKELENKQKINAKDLQIQYALSKPKKPYNSLGVGIHNDTFYFGTTLDIDGKKKDAVVTSNKEIFIGKEIKENFGLNYRFEFFDDCLDRTWSNDSIKAWLYGAPEVISIKDCFKKLKEINQKYIYYADERAHTYIACDIIATYFLPNFETRGRTYNHADKGSGKTKQCQIYALTAFNPIFSADWSGASLYRTIESTSATVIIDDFDLLDEEKKATILTAIRVGYKVGQKSIRADGNKSNRPRGYQLYSSCCFNNITGVDDVTDDRCFTIRMFRTDAEITKRKLDMKNSDWQIIRDDLYIIALRNWKEVQKTYDNLKVIELTARELEVVEAVLTIAKLVGDDVYKEVLEFVLESYKQNRIRDVSDDWEYILLKYLEPKEAGQSTLEVKEIGWQKVSDIAEALVDELFIELKRSDKDGQLYETPAFTKARKGFTVWLGKYLKRNGFKGRFVNGKAEYQIDGQKIKRLLELKFKPSEETKND
jgi:hypothetical protein